MDERSQYYSALDISSRFDYSVVDLNTEPKSMLRAVHNISRSEPPVAIWMALPAPYSMNIAGSLAHPAIKKLFELWGSSDREISWRGYTFTVDSGDLSVSTEFSNSDKDWCSLSLTGDGLALSITSNGEQSVLTVPADRLDQAELFEDWFPHIQLH